MQLRERQHSANLFTIFLVERMLAGSGVIFLPANRLSPPTADEYRATPFLALRAAHRAIASDGNHPDGYYALARALADRDLPLSDDERRIGQITALRQCLDRLPKPEQFRPGVYIASPSEVAWELAQMYLGRRQETGSATNGISIGTLSFALLYQGGNSGFLRAAQVMIPTPGGISTRSWVGRPEAAGGFAPNILPLDLVYETLQTVQKYVTVEFRQDSEELRGRQRRIEQELQDIQRRLGQANTYYERAKQRAGGKLISQVEAALENNLVGEALRLLTDKEVDPGKDFGANPIKIVLSRIALEMVVGRLEESAADLNMLLTNSQLDQHLASNDIAPIYRMLTYQQQFLEGNYGEAGATLERLQGRLVGLDPAKSLRDKFDPKPYVGLGDKLSLWLDYNSLTAIAAPTTQDYFARVFGARIAASGFINLQNDLHQHRSRDAEFFKRCGILALFGGDIPAAKARFLQTRLPANKEWGLPEYRDNIAELYLRLFDEAEKRAAKK
jgi:hypothetical protein